MLVNIDSANNVSLLNGATQEATLYANRGEFTKIAKCTRQCDIDLIAATIEQKRKCLTYPSLRADPLFPSQAKISKIGHKIRRRFTAIAN